MFPHSTKIPRNVWIKRTELVSGDFSLVLLQPFTNCVTLGKPLAVIVNVSCQFDTPGTPWEREPPLKSHHRYIGL